MRTIYVINMMPSRDIALNDMLDPDGTIERPFRNIQEALYYLEDDKDPNPHALVYPPDTEFIVIDFPKKLLSRSNKMELLNSYSIWLTKNGYMDTDWKDEEPFAIDSFLKEQK